MKRKLREVKKILDEYNSIKGEVWLICKSCFNLYNTDIVDIRIDKNNVSVDLAHGSVEFPKKWLEIESNDELFEEIYKYKEEKINSRWNEFISRYENDIKEVNRKREEDLESAREELTKFRERWGL